MKEKKKEKETRENLSLAQGLSMWTTEVKD